MVTKDDLDYDPVSTLTHMLTILDRQSIRDPQWSNIKENPANDYMTKELLERNKEERSYYG